MSASAGYWRLDNGNSSEESEASLPASTVPSPGSSRSRIDGALPARVPGQVFLLAVVPAIFFLRIQSPVWMVVLGGISQAAMLPVITFCTLYLRYRRLPKSVEPSAFTTGAVWVSAAVMVFMVGYSLIKRQ